VRRASVLLAVLVLVGGCQSGSKIEVRTHSFAACHAGALSGWVETIKTTVAPEDWNVEGSPHRIYRDGLTVTVRTNVANQKAICDYLRRVASM